MPELGTEPRVRILRGHPECGEAAGLWAGGVCAGVCAGARRAGRSVQREQPRVGAASISLSLSGPLTLLLGASGKARYLLKRCFLVSLSFSGPPSTSQLVSGAHSSAP